jgi:hypothetical protein
MPKTRAAQLASSIAVNGPRRNDADEGRYASAQHELDDRTIGRQRHQRNAECRHVLPGMQEQAAETFERLILG